jgi:hypothetical protein
VVGDIVFGGYQFPKSFIVGSNEPTAESDVVSIPTSVGSNVPLPKWASRLVSVVGTIGGHLHNAAGVEILTLQDVQAEIDALMSGLNQAMVNGQQPLILPSWDRYVVGYPQKPKRTDVEGSGYRASTFDIPFFCGDPRAFLCTPGNLVPDSDVKLLGQYWNMSGSTLTIGWMVAPGGTSAFKITGTGLASAFQVASDGIIPVTPGQTYTLSGFIDARTCSVSQPFWGVYDVAIQTAIAQAFQTDGVQGRVSATFTVPAGMTAVRVIFDSNNCTITNATALVGYQPKLEAGSTASAYSSDIYTPSNTASNAVITNTSLHTLSAINAGNARAYPTILLATGPGANVGFAGITLTMTNPDGTVLTITLSPSCIIKNGAVLIINCDPIRPSAYISPQIPPRSAFSGSNTQWPFATFASTAANMELLPYLDPGTSLFGFTVTGAPAGGSISLFPSLIWDNVVI